MPLGLHTTTLNFETIREIGHEGRNSQVYLAHDKQLDGEIVIKKVPKIKILNPSDYFNESKILHASAHPYVVDVNYGCEDNDYIYLAMPYYSNGSLKSLMNTKHLTIREVIRYTIQFLSGLNNVHSKRLIHFDVKPDNILLSNSDEALLSDFGLAKAMNTLGFASPDAVYPKQVPPETFTSSSKNHQYDIYLAGLTIYRALNGNDHYTSQFNFSTQQDYINAIVRGNFPSRANYLPHIPLKLQRIVNNALEVDLNDRYSNVLKLINELSSVSENLDWRYSSTGNIDIWTKEDSDRIFTVKLEKDANNRTLTTSRTVKASGNTTNVNDHCYNNLTTNNVNSRLSKALREL